MVSRPVSGLEWERHPYSGCHNFRGGETGAKPVLTRNRKAVKTVEPEHLLRKRNRTLDRRGLRDGVRHPHG